MPYIKITDENDIQSLDTQTDLGDYRDLKNKPSINGHVLVGNKTNAELGIIIPDTSKLATKEEVGLLSSKVDTKQDLLIAGDNVKIEDNIVSAILPEAEDPIYIKDGKIGIQLDDTLLVNEQNGKMYVPIDNETIKLDSGKLTAVTSKLVNGRGTIANGNSIDVSLDTNTLDVSQDNKIRVVGVVSDITGEGCEITKSTTSRGLLSYKIKVTPAGYVAGKGISIIGSTISVNPATVFKAGDNVELEMDSDGKWKISALNSVYLPGDGLKQDGSTLSVDLNQDSDLIIVDGKLDIDKSKLQNKLVAKDGIDIDVYNNISVNTNEGLGIKNGGLSVLSGPGISVDHLNQITANVDGTTIGLKDGAISLVKDTGDNLYISGSDLYTDSDRTNKLNPSTTYSNVSNGDTDLATDMAAVKAALATTVQPQIKKDTSYVNALNINTSTAESGAPIYTLGVPLNSSTGLYVNTDRKLSLRTTTGDGVSIYNKGSVDNYALSGRIILYDNNPGLELKENQQGSYPVNGLKVKFNPELLQCDSEGISIDKTKFNQYVMNTFKVNLTTGELILK